MIQRPDSRLRRDAAGRRAVPARPGCCVPGAIRRTPGRGALPGLAAGGVLLVLLTGCRTLAPAPTPASPAAPWPVPGELQAEVASVVTAALC